MEQEVAFWLVCVYRAIRGFFKDRGTYHFTKPK